MRLCPKVETFLFRKVAEWATQAATVNITISIMTSASLAVKRLQSESLQQKSLNELKQDAAELGLSKEDVKQFGSLTYKQTWLDAVGDAIGREFEAIAEENAIPTPQPKEITPLPIPALIPLGEVGEKMLTLAQPSTTPLKDELTERMRRYVGETMTPQEFEALQNEPLDEMTAAIYLGWLEGGEQILVEAMAA